MMLSSSSVLTVSIHAPARGATGCCYYGDARAARFQSTRPRGARHADMIALYNGIIDVSIHAPARGATARHSIPPANTVQFQSTRPRGARPDEPFIEGFHTRSFNPRAREGRDRKYGVIRASKIVSIHAPARGATWKNGMVPCVMPKVSIHAPARGATKTNCSEPVETTGFNPRAREGRDLSFLYPHELQTLVSIHAPARGATSVAIIGQLPKAAVSIHAPARGATKDFRCTRFISRIVSIHAPARGATN